MKLFNHLCLLFLFILAFCLSIKAQTNISGVINSYIDITTVNIPNNSITVSSSTNFNIGDRVLIIQMKGASINESQSANFGTITNYNNSGNYEFQTICNIQGNTIFFLHNILHNYDPTGAVQLINVPTYTNALIASADITAESWNGVTGGVLVFEVSGTLDFGMQNINVTGKGFRGGNAVISGGNCNFLLDDSYYTAITSSDEKALKGEGIANTIIGKECGRGSQANGGGGGNNHNGGGSGGGNYGSGGTGGERLKSTPFTCGSVIGTNSKNLISGYNSNKIFMGGAGGAGHGNNTGTFGENGLNGGGIVIIKANTIIGNNQTILADGDSALINAEGEGGGGAGAGGTVLIEASNFSNNLNISTQGGNGTDIENIGSSNCNGPGGGGGGGIIWLSENIIPTNISTATQGGDAGTIVSTAQTNCTLGSKNGALDGENGTTLTELILQEGNVINATENITEIACNQYTSPSGKYIWNTSNIYTDTITNGSISGCDSIITINLTIDVIDTSVTQTGALLSANEVMATYRWLNCGNGYTLINNETNQSFTATTNGNYAVEITKNGCTDTSSCFSIINLSISKNGFENKLTFHPNPTKGRVIISLNKTYKKIIVSLLDITGKTMNSSIYIKSDLINFEIKGVKGFYLLKIETSSGKSAIIKVLKD